jgi:hypothetical protein
MRARAAIAGTILALLGALASTAQAAPAAPAPAAVKAPASVVVANDGAIALKAHDDSDGQLCVGIDTAGGSAESCEDSDSGVVVVTGATSDMLYAGIATLASAASVELRRAGQLLAAGPTVAGETYHGKRAGKVRFALLRLPAKSPADGLRIRALDAHGALVEVLAPGSEAELVFDRHRLLSGTYAGTRWSIDASQSSALTPSVLDLAHESVSRCADVRIREGGSSTSSSRCVGTAPRDSLSLVFDDASLSSQDSCTPLFRLLHGIVEASVQRVTFLLGDGRRRSARTAPFGDGARIVYALAIPRGAAVRSVTLDRGPAGSTVKRLAIAPLTVECATGDADGFSAYASLGDPFFSPFANLPTVTPPGPVTTVAGTPSFRVADGPGDSLCLALGDLPFNAFSCAIVAPALDELLGAFDSFVSPRSFVIALPARVAAIRISTAEGKTARTIATVPAPGYKGIYASAVRFAAATVGATRELDNLDLLDAAGNVLHSERDDTSGPADEAARFTGRQRIAGRAGHPSLWQTNFRAGKSRSHCLALTTGQPPSRAGRCQATRSSSSVLLHASCVSHRLTVAVTVAEGTRVRAGGRTIRLRRGAGLLTLPSKRPLKALTFVRKGKSQRVRIDAPAGARQCGWSAAPSVTLRRLK